MVLHLGLVISGQGKMGCQCDGALPLHTLIISNLAFDSFVFLLKRIYFSLFNETTFVHSHNLTSAVISPDFAMQKEILRINVGCLTSPRLPSIKTPIVPL